MRTLLAAASLATLALAMPPTAQPTLADDNWTPFGTPNDSPPPRRKAAPAANSEPARPYLSPMDGSGSAQSGRRSNAQPQSDDMPPAGGGYGVPYGQPYPQPGEPAAGNSQPGRGADGGRAAVSREPLAAPVEEKARGVDRGDLQPVMAGDGSGLPYELWRGLDVKTVETLIARIEIPPRSPALHDLWRRLITSNVTPPGGAQLNAGFDAIRAEVLFRSGMLKEAAASLDARREGTDAVLSVLAARNDIALGNRDKGCGAVKAATASKAEMPKPLRAEALEMLGFCAAAAGNPSAAGLAAELARDEGLNAPGLALLDSVAAGSKPQLQHLKTISAVDYRLIEMAKGGDDPHIIAKAQPALLAMLALDAATPPVLRLAAAEQAARLNAIPPEALADFYRALSAPEAGEAPPAGGKAADSPQHRANLFKSAESERTPLKKVRLLRAFLDDTRRAGLYLPALQLCAKPAAALQVVPEIGWFAETGVEIALAAGDYGKARQWANFGAGLDRQPGGPASAPPAGLSHWLALADIADARIPKGERGRDLGQVEELALRGRFTPDQLHRLATVLDALDYNVPMRLWEAASRTPQPTTGHLPATGVLSELQDASKKKEFGRTVLLAMDTLGGNGAEGAHMIALGDSIRALRRAGLDADARRLGFEALFSAWPRGGAN